MEPTSEHQSEIQTNKTPAKPLGEVLVPMLICGVVGFVLTIILSVIGMYDGLNISLKEYYMGEPFYMPESSGWDVAWDWLIVVVLTFGVSYAVLDTDKSWRRVMLILLTAVVVILSSPALMLWDVFWSPVTVFVGVLWSWICAFTYSSQHTMPCELLVPPKQGEEIDISPLVITERKKELVEHIEREETAEKKYQPKEQSSCPD